jgi:hypothetical protein
MLRVPRQGCGIRGLSGNAGARVGWFLPCGGRRRDGCEQYRKNNPGGMKHINQIWEMSVTSTPMPEFEGSLGEETKKGAGKLASASPNPISGKPMTYVSAVAALPIPGTTASRSLAPEQWCSPL